MYLIARWGDGEWGVVVGFLDRIDQTNQRLENGMRGASQGIKWSQSVSRLETVIDRNPLYISKGLLQRN